MILPPLRSLAVGLLFLASCAASHAEAPRPSPVSYRHVARDEPKVSVHVVTIDLTDPRVDVEVSRGGPDPDGPGPWTTTLMTTRQVAERQRYDITINGDFFSVERVVDPNSGKPRGYHVGQKATVSGPAATDGQRWAKNAATRPALVVGARPRADIARFRPEAPLPRGAQQVIAGSHVIVAEGKKVEVKGSFSTARHPRTAVGVSRDGNMLILLVVDGRQPRLSVGMSLSELADEMLGAGAHEALNLDGGGSTTLVYRDPTSKSLNILNSPSDGRERTVANVLGVRVNAPLPAPAAAK